MKKLFLILVSMFTLSGVIVAKPTLSEKAIAKMAKKEAKQLKKQGWNVAPGALPMEVQLQRRYTKESDINEFEQPTYYIGESEPIANFYDAASLQASTMCKLRIAEQLGGKMEALIQAEVGNKQVSGVMSQEEAVSVQQVTAAISELVQAKLVDIIPLVEVSKKLSNGNIQIRKVMCYPRAAADKVAKEAIASKLEEKIKGLSKKLDSLK